MTRPSLARALRRAALTVAVLTAGCLSRWSGCRHYDAGRLAGPGWTARVTCDPHTELDLAGLHGCTARWNLVVERGRDRQVSPLRGPRYASPDCGEVRRLCASARGELAQRPTAAGTWVAGRSPGGDTRLAFVPAACGFTYLLPGDASSSALPPGEAVARQPDGPAFLDGVVARETIASAAWPLVCGPALASRLAAVRAAALECRVPEGVADELFRTDPASVGAVWSAFVEGRLPCSEATLRALREHAATVLGEVVLAQLAACEVRCPPRARVEALREAGTLRLPGVRATALRLASAGPPPWVARDDASPAWTAYRDACDAWLAAQWALSRVDPERGTEVALATLRRLPTTPGVARLPVSRAGPPEADYDDPGGPLCAIVLGDPARARAGLWQVASDEGASEGARQHALLALAGLGDPRASGATLAHNPLTAEQSAMVQGATAPSGGTSSGGGHHHRHWH
jgi:hypothetical protein